MQCEAAKAQATRMPDGHIVDGHRFVDKPADALAAQKTSLHDNLMDPLAQASRILFCIYTMNEGAVGKLKIEKLHFVVGFEGGVVAKLISTFLWLAVLYTRHVCYSELRGT